MNKLYFLLGTFCAGFLLSSTPARAAAPAAPDYVDVAWMVNRSEFLVRWLPVADAASYNVYRYDTNTSGWLPVATNLSFLPWNVLTFREPASPDPGAGTYAVTAVNADGEGPATGASVVPGPVWSSFSCQTDWWPRGYTFVQAQCSGDYQPGTVGMVDVSVDQTNFTHGVWRTNIQMQHVHRITNLVPGAVYFTRLTQVETNGSGWSSIYPPYGIYTLPLTPINVWEDTVNNIDIGDITWNEDITITPAQIVTPPAHGALAYQDFKYRWTYTPDLNFVGSDTFEILDNPAGPPVTLTLNVQNVNDPPVPMPFTVYVPEDTSTVITPPVTDLENDPYNVWPWEQPANGSAWPQGNTFVYTPYENFVGNDPFTYYAMDQDWMGTAQGLIIVTNVNDAPVAEDSFATTSEDTPITFTLNASDVDGDPLSMEFGTLPQYGAITNTGLSVTYSPNLNYHGADSFSYRVSDGQVNSEWKTVDLLVNPVNDGPTADDKSASTAEDQSVSITLSGSDTDGDSLVFVIVTPPQHGEFTGDTYIPAANYYGSDSFTYKASDGQLDSAVATVSITITPVNDAPVADNKSAVVDEDGSVAVGLTGSDGEGSALNFAVVTPPANGTFANGTYTPAANYNGSDSFTYKANDGQLDSTLATVSITVNAVNDAPVANDQSVSTPYNTAVNIVLTGSDVEGSALSFTTLTSPANGTLSGTGANRTFTPSIGWYGTTSFTFKVNDGALDSTTATVTITVAGPGSVPAAPSGLTATAVSQSQINLAWNDNSGNEDGFKIERATNSGGPWTQIGTVGPDVSSYASTGLSKNKRYYYRVRAHNVLGNSAYSNTANARTLP